MATNAVRYTFYTVLVTLTSIKSQGYNGENISKMAKNKTGVLVRFHYYFLINRYSLLKMPKYFIYMF